MENNTHIRIRTQPGNEKEKYVQLKLEHEVDTLEIMSLNISKTSIYRSFSSNFGCIVGRVMSSDVGLPNAKVSVFIPLDSQDENNPEILKYYPYKTPRDKDGNGTRYNLLPRLSLPDIKSGWGYNKLGAGYHPQTPVGTMPVKHELLCDDSFVEVYDKYYRFSTVTNESGDFMIMGVPVGRHTVHMDVDLTDIGQFSMKPATMIKKLGFPMNLFTRKNRVKFNNDLSRVPNVMSMDLDVDVKPFWGDEDNTEVGFTRQDFIINASINPSFTIFGSNMTMARNRWWGDYQLIRVQAGIARLCINIPLIKETLELFPIPYIVGLDGDDQITKTNDDDQSRIYGGQYDLSAVHFHWNGFSDECSSKAKQGVNLVSNDGIDLRNHRIGKLNYRIYSFPEGIDTIQSKDDFKKMRLLEEDEYYSVTEDGAFGILVFCNRSRKFTNEFGQLVPSKDKGVFTEFRGFMYAGMDELPIDNPPTTRRTKRTWMKIPQQVDYHVTDGAGGFKPRITDEDYSFFNAHTFRAGSLYTTAQLYADEATYLDDDINGTRGTLYDQRNNFTALYHDTGKDTDTWDINVGHIRDTNAAGLIGNYLAESDNIFANEYLHMCLYFPQYQYRTRKGGFIGIGKTKDETPSSLVRVNRAGDNSHPIGPVESGSKGLIRSDRYRTYFVDVPKNDLNKFALSPNKGFRVHDGANTEQGEINSITLVKDANDAVYNAANQYRKLNRPSYEEGYYFYKGLRGADAVRLITEYNLL